jgi:uncharacterized protein RhaS with RHS repeats
MGARVYDPYTGTFLQADPIQGGGATPYGYTDGDPVNETDISGNSVVGHPMCGWNGHNYEASRCGGPTLSDVADVLTPLALVDPAGDLAVLGGAEEAEDATTLFRGVAEDHPGFQDALEGKATPRGGPASAAEHNAGNTDSPFTSWTTDPGVARNFAGDRGVVLSKSWEGLVTVRSPDAFGESEVLVKGSVTGAKVSR